MTRRSALTGQRLDHAPESARHSGSPLSRTYVLLDTTPLRAGGTTAPVSPCAPGRIHAPAQTLAACTFTLAACGVRIARKHAIGRVHALRAVRSAPRSTKHRVHPAIHTSAGKPTQRPRTCFLTQIDQPVLGTCRGRRHRTGLSGTRRFSHACAHTSQISSGWLIKRTMIRDAIPARVRSVKWVGIATAVEPTRTCSQRSDADSADDCARRIRPPPDDQISNAVDNFEVDANWLVPIV